MTVVIDKQRSTKYCLAIKDRLEAVGHATNAELLCYLRDFFPDLSATTVHRVTARLLLRGEISIAPAKYEGSMCYDSNIVPHDHFKCSSCGLLKDIDIKDRIISILEESIDDCGIYGRLVINGKCKKCIRKQGEYYENNNI